MKVIRTKVQRVSHTSGMKKKKPQNFANLNIRVQKVLKHGSKSGKKKKKRRQHTGMYGFCVQKVEKNRSPCHSINNLQHLPYILV